MKTTNTYDKYIKKLLKLDKKLKRINRTFEFWIDTYFSYNHNILNDFLCWRNEKFKIDHDEFEYITYWYSCFTFDWEERFYLELKDDDKKNLEQYLSFNKTTNE